MRPDRAFITVLALALFTILADAVPASAQGGFFGWFGGSRDDRYPQRQNQNSWFGGGERRDSWFGRQEREVPPQANAYSDPSNAPGREQVNTSPSLGTGRAVAYCVRLCDGRYFPMQRHANATSIQLCNAFCPAAKTQVFNGSQIDHAVSSNGTRYADLANAFVYREKVVADCTCNGKTPFGLMTLNAASDPTLRQGDIVSNGDNVKAALIANAAKTARAAEQQARLNTKQAKAAPAVPEAPTPDDPPED